MAEVRSRQAGTRTLVSGSRMTLSDPPDLRRANEEIARSLARSSLRRRGWAPSRNVTARGTSRSFEWVSRFVPQQICRKRPYDLLVATPVPEPQCLNPKGPRFGNLSNRAPI